MISRYNVTLDGESLSAVAPQILITDIQYAFPNYQIETYNVAKRHGSLIHRTYLDKSSVTISFVIREYDTTARQMICAAVSKWAKKGGALRTSDRPGQHLDCVCGKHPAISSAKNWLDELSITFDAYALPFWVDDIQSTASFTGSSKSGAIYVPGNADYAFIEVTAKVNAAITTLTLNCGSTSMTIVKSVAKNHTIRIAYDSHMIQSIKDNTTSILKYRTGSDDLIAACGESTAVSYSASASVSVTFSARGWWV